MDTPKAREIRKSIQQIESQISYTTGMISLLMAEGNLIDAQIEEFSQSGLFLKSKLADLQAELADSI